MKNRTTARLIGFFSIIGAVVAIDQVTKLLCVRYLKDIVDVPLWEGVLHLHYIENRGAAFGMLSGARWVFITLTVAAVVGVVWYILKKKAAVPTLELVSLALIAGGAVGNLIDRIFLGYVVDFIYVKIIDFAIFNGADSAVTVGTAILAVYILFFALREDKSKKADGPHGNSDDKV